VQSVYQQIIGKENGELNNFLSAKNIQSAINRLIIQKSEVTSDFGIEIMQEIFRFHHSGFEPDKICEFLDFA